MTWLMRLRISKASNILSSHLEIPKHRARRSSSWRSAWKWWQSTGPCSHRAASWVSSYPIRHLSQSSNYEESSFGKQFELAVTWGPGIRWLPPELGNQLSVSSTWWSAEARIAALRWLAWWTSGGQATPHKPGRSKKVTYFQRWQRTGR